MGRNKFSESEIKEIAKLLRLKNAGNRHQQKLVRHDLRVDYEFNISDFNQPGKAFGEEELHDAIRRGAIVILDEQTIADMKAKPKPIETEPAAIGRVVRRGRRLFFLLTAPIAIEEAIFIAMNAAEAAISMLLSTALMLVPMPVFLPAAMSVHALRVKIPSFVKKDLYRIARSGGAMKRKIRTDNAMDVSFVPPFVLLRSLRLLRTFVSSLPYPVMIRRIVIIKKEKTARAAEDEGFTSVYVRL